VTLAHENLRSLASKLSEAGPANFNSQKCHIIRKHSPEDLNCVYIYRKGWGDELTRTPLFKTSGELQLRKIFFANKGVTLCSPDLLYYVC